MGGDALPEIGKTIGRQVLKSRVQFWPFLFFFFNFLYLFLERGEGKQKEMERNISVWLPLMCPALGTRPATEACDSPQDWESNQQPFGSQAHAQSTELHQPGPDLAISDLGQKSTKRCQVGFQLCLVSGEQSGLGCRLGYH